VAKDYVKRVEQENAPKIVLPGEFWSD
jgi:hypothetical protein